MGDLGMDLTLKLAQLLSRKGGEFQERAEELFVSALKLFKVKKTSIPCTLFEYESAAHHDSQNSLIEEGVAILGSKFLLQNAFQECIKTLGDIQLPMATFFLSECYRRLNIPGTPKKNRQANFDRAAQFHNRTIELLAQSNCSENHPLKCIVNTTNPFNEVFEQVAAPIAPRKIEFDDTNEAKASLVDSTIIGLVLNDDTVIDSNGEQNTLDHYINKVTPHHESADLYENFHVNNEIEMNDIGAMDDIGSMAVCHNETELHNESFNFESLHGTHSQKAIKASRVCPIRGCDRIIKHYSRNASRHIKEFHGEKLNGKWVLKRYKCAACNKKNIVKLAKRPENLKPHFERYHENETPSAMPEYLPLELPLEFKEEFEIQH